MTASVNKPLKRILGIDFGLARMGLAISDERLIIASPLPNFLAFKSLPHTVSAFLKRLEEIETYYKSPIDQIIMSHPLKLSGERAEMAKKAEDFAAALKEKTSIPIIFWDERLTTAQAERMLKEQDFNRKKRSQLVDQVAASILLQSYLDHLKFANP
jgi:putative Holliday junction resolvase